MYDCNETAPEHATSLHKKHTCTLLHPGWGRGPGTNVPSVPPTCFNMLFCRSKHLLWICACQEIKWLVSFRLNDSICINRDVGVCWPPYSLNNTPLLVNQLRGEKIMLIVNTRFRSSIQTFLIISSNLDLILDIFIKTLLMLLIIHLISQAFVKSLEPKTRARSRCAVKLDEYPPHCAAQHKHL